MAIVFDPANQRIVLDTFSVTATEIYSRWVDWAALSDNIKYGMVIRQVGSDDLGSGLTIPPYYFLQGGWRVRPQEAHGLTTITGNLFVDGGGSPVVQTLGNFNSSVQFTVPVQAQGFSAGGTTVAPLSAQDKVDIANAVLGSLPAYPTSPNVVQIRQEIDNNSTQLAAILNGLGTGGLTNAQATQLLELWRLSGLDIANPATTSSTARTAGDIDLVISGDPSTSVTVTRQ